MNFYKYILNPSLDTYKIPNEKGRKELTQNQNICTVLAEGKTNKINSNKV